MASIMPLVVIVGPTASGKSDVALKIAREFDGEIVTADSRTVYRGLDIGTAKVSEDEQLQIPHHLVDVVTPVESFTLWDFQQLASKAIDDIRSRNKLPILVGGSGLYIDSIVFDYKLGEPSNPEYREKLESESIESLHMMLKNQRIDMPINAKNKRHLIRALEQQGVNDTRRKTLVKNCIVAGIATDKMVLEKRIRERITTMFERGVVEEATTMAKMYGWDTEALSGNIYRLAREVADGSMTVADAIEKAVVLDRRLAKRQRTWFKRNPYIVWNNIESTEAYLVDELHRLGLISVLR